LNAIITWNANTETDLAGYKLYKAIDTQTPVVIATIQKGTQTYTDTLADGEYTVTYTLSAIDKTGHESLKNPSVWKVIDTNPPLAPTGLDLVLQ